LAEFNFGFFKSHNVLSIVLGFKIRSFMGVVQDCVWTCMSWFEGVGEDLGAKFVMVVLYIFYLH